MLPTFGRSPSLAFMIRRCVIILCLSCGLCRAEFAPAEPALFRTYQDDYFGFLQQTVFKSFGTHYLVGFCAFPSFKTEWGLWMFYDRDWNVMMHIAEAEESLFQAGKFVASDDEKPATPEERTRLLVPNVKIKERDVSLDQELAKRIVACWQETLFAARSGRWSPGSDGITCYYFAADRDNRSAAWRQWSPASDTDAGMLAELAYALRDFSDGSEAHRARLVEKLERAETHLRSIQLAPARDGGNRFGLLHAKRSGSEVLRLSHDELRRHKRGIPAKDPDVFLESRDGRQRWVVTWSLHDEIFTVFVDDESGATVYSGKEPK